MSQHLSFPLRLDGGHIATDPQDTIAEIESSVYLLLLTPVGSREENPDFGTDPLVFDQVPLDTESVQDQIERWEPRSLTTFSEFLDDIEDGIVHLEAVIDKRLESAS